MAGTCVAVGRVGPLAFIDHLSFDRMSIMICKVYMAILPATIQTNAWTFIGQYFRE